MLDTSRSHTPFDLAQQLIFSVPQKYQDSGTSKVGIDLAIRISQAAGITPHIILSEQIPQTFRDNPNSLIVGIGLNEEQLREHKADKRIFKVGYSDYFSHGRTAGLHDVFLNPRFFPSSSRTHEQVAANNVEVIDYTYLPSRITPRKQNAQERRGKKVVAYYRALDNNKISRKFFDDTAFLHDKLGYTFFVTTGYSTTDPIVDALEEHFGKLSGSRFCRYDSNKREGCMQFYEQAYAEADAAVVTDDTVSGLSDAANSLLPTYLLTSQSNAQWLWQKSGKIHPLDQANIEHKLQLDLFRQGRLKVFSRNAFNKIWHPECVDEWESISTRIVEKLHRHYSVNAVMIS